MRSKLSRVALVLALAQGSACSDEAKSSTTAGHGADEIAGAAAGAAATGGAAAGEGSANTAGIGAEPPAHAGTGGSAGSADNAEAGSSAGAAVDGGSGSPGPAPIVGEGTVTKDGNKYKATITVHRVAPGGEDHRCVIVELPNTEPAWVNELHATLSDGSHHLIVDRSLDDVAQNAALPCSPTMAGDATRLLIAQQHDTHVTLPKGVAYQLAARQKVFLQLHYINLKETPAEIQGSVELQLADIASPPKEAHSLFTGPLGFVLPPHEKTSVRGFLAPAASAPSTRHVFALTSHTHSLGIRATIERAADAMAASTKPLHESLNWAEPPLTLLDPPLAFSDGGDGLRLICQFQNNGDGTVNFGTGFHDEMCFMWMYYYDE